MPESPFLLLHRLATGYAIPRCLHVVTELGIADRLGDEPQTAAALALAAGVQAQPLERVMRLLSTEGVFVLRSGRFAHSAASRLLRKDHPRSQRALVRLLGRSWQLRLFEELEYVVRTGHPASDKVMPNGFGFFAEHPEEGELFDAAMAALSEESVPGILAAYDFSRFAVIGDIGCGRGHLLLAILEATPNATGVLFDLPSVPVEIPAPLAHRAVKRSGDFFRDELPSCDCYLLKEVIHDWGDAEAGRILTAVRRAAPAQARILLLETLHPEDAAAPFAALYDVHMMLAGGRQRTPGELERLCRAAGLRIERVIPTGSRVSIVEGIAV
ncbi:MAG TPA: methyltransferase [Steroidobacteraceae bacterium]|nr:methyltransferase [Steroidobacteraceae bacterium]